MVVHPLNANVGHARMKQQADIAQRQAHVPRARPFRLAAQGHLDPELRGEGGQAQQLPVLCITAGPLRRVGRPALHAVRHGRLAARVGLVLQLVIRLAHVGRLLGERFREDRAEQGPLQPLPAQGFCIIGGHGGPAGLPSLHGRRERQRSSRPRPVCPRFAARARPPARGRPRLAEASKSTSACGHRRPPRPAPKIRPGRGQTNLLVLVGQQLFQLLYRRLAGGQFQGGNYRGKRIAGFSCANRPAQCGASAGPTQATRPRPPPGDCQRRSGRAAGPKAGARPACWRSLQPLQGRQQIIVQLAPFLSWPCCCRSCGPARRSRGPRCRWPRAAKARPPGAAGRQQPARRPCALVVVAAQLPDQRSDAPAGSPRSTEGGPERPAHPPAWWPDAALPQEYCRRFPGGCRRILTQARFYQQSGRDE